jgi:tungstate transport system ATP-binding protein
MRQAAATAEVPVVAPPRAAPRADAASAALPLSVRDLALARGGRRLIDGVGFTLEAGPLTVVLGPNGAGKSLLLRLCHGLIQPSGGTISWNGMSAERARRCHAMVFQRPVMLRRSALANVSYALAAAGFGWRDRRRLAAEALERVGLGDVAGRSARVLSGGEQQRVAIARALALRPQVLFLDEPTASLDVAGTRAVEDLVVAIHRGGTKVIMTTHDFGQARRLGDEVLFLHGGRLVEHTPADEFFRRPRSTAAAAFLAGGLPE